MEYQKEFIVCAAMMYKDIVVPGRRHNDCYTLIESLLGDVNTEDIPKRENQGFLTSHNRYVSREEAFTIAQENNQIWHNVHGDAKEGSLVSEDLYDFEEGVEPWF
jgi:hypothetical protein